MIDAKSYTYSFVSTCFTEKIVEILKKVFIGGGAKNLHVILSISCIEKVLVDLRLFSRKVIFLCSWLSCHALCRKLMKLQKLPSLLYADAHVIFSMTFSFEIRKD